MKCIKCHHELDTSQKFCQYCGTPVEMSLNVNKKQDYMLKCKVCGSLVKPGNIYCTSCGAPMDKAGVVQQGGKKKKNGKGMAFVKVFLIVTMLIAAALIALVVMYFVVLGNQDKDRISDTTISENETDDSGTDEGQMNSGSEDNDQVESVDKLEEDAKASEDVSEVLKEDADEGLGETEKKAAKGDKTSDVQEEKLDEDDVYMEKENEKSPDPSKEILEGQTNPVDDAVDVEAEVEYIRTIYYGVTMHPDDFRTYESADHITVYEAKSDQHIQCIVADIGAYSQDNFALSDKYAAEYYYDYDANSGKYTQRFIFVHNKDYSEEYRIYLTADQKCLRYIGPYESAETTYDYEYPIADLESITPVYQFHTYGWRELHLMGIY